MTGVYRAMQVTAIYYILLSTTSGLFDAYTDPDPSTFSGPSCNILEGLTRCEQHEISSLITNVVLAIDNNVHSVYLDKLDHLMAALHTSDVSNTTKPLRIYLVLAERIKQEFYQKGDKERELLLPANKGYDREQHIALEKLQACFMIDIVRPLFLT
ncbi:hypothetical protein PsorP6_011693 [Peronosclerospora sorghi]|uniref:Uncharacterized protein n=1 Tax=Peronosclerospora sorghi TaxID=230839 RepID=A0ACC0WIX8_9STRA|nr:hypothetical protein PsorP6_011693 [Peronosclerospora sorghi]